MKASSWGAGREGGWLAFDIDRSEVAAIGCLHASTANNYFVHRVTVHRVFMDVRR